jgi:hypothetical protein
MARRRRETANPVQAAAETASAELERDRLPRGSARQIGSTLSRGPGMLTQYMAPANFSRLIEYERAAKTDETVGAGIEFMKLSLIASVRQYRHPDAQIQTFVRKAIDEMEGTVEYAIGELTESSLIFGYSVSEVLWKLVEGKIQIDELINYHPASLLIVPNVHGRLIDKAPLDNPYYTPPAGITHCGIWQIGVDGATYNHLPKSKLCLTVHNKRSGMYTGTSAIQKVYKNWTLKDIVLEMYNVALDRYGTPITYAVVPAGVTPDSVHDHTTGKLRNMTIREAAEAALAEMHRGTALVFQRPSMQDDIKIDTLTTGNNFGTVFLDAINYYNRAIFRGLLIPQLLLEEGSAGLSNPGQTHWNVFKLMIQALAKEIVEPFCEQVIGQMIRLNFGNTDPGEFIIEPFDPATSTVLASVFDKLVKNGYLNPADEQDLNEVREMFGLPSKTLKPILSQEDQKKILMAPVKKVDNDKIKADAAMVRAKASVEAVSQKDRDLEVKKQDLATKAKMLKDKQKMDSEKASQDFNMKNSEARYRHRENMASIAKGAQPGTTSPEPGPQQNQATPKPPVKE